MANLANLIEYAADVEANVMDYNTADFALYAYSLAKMTRPTTIVEFGTGMGVTSLMMAQACKDNGYGKVITIDDGSQNLPHYANYFEGLQANVEGFDLCDYFDFRQASIAKASDFAEIAGDAKDVGIVFNDFSSEPQVLRDILEWLLPRAADECFFITDRGYTYEPNYKETEKMVTFLNALYKTKRFSSHYVKKHTDTDQDSFSVIKIEVRKC